MLITATFFLHEEPKRVTFEGAFDLKIIDPQPWNFHPTPPPPHTFDINLSTDDRLFTILTLLPYST